MRIIIKFLAKIISLIMYRIKIEGKENFPKTGAALICPNHIHPLDGPIIIANAKRKINVLAKEELFKGFIGKRFAKIFGIYPIKRDRADINAIKISLKLLKSQELLMVFPEGTRNGLKKGCKPKNGPVMMAIKANVPIIPIGIQGTLKPFTKVKINIGKPIYYEQYKNKTADKEFISNLTKELMNKVIELRDKK